LVVTCTEQLVHKTSQVLLREVSCRNASIPSGRRLESVSYSVLAAPRLGFELLARLVKLDDEVMMANNNRADDSVSEEVSAVGQRVKGAAKDATGAVLGNERLEREGERENAEGRKRQAENDAIGDRSRTRPSSAGWSTANLVTGLYETPDAASKAYEALTTRHGYKADDISVVMSDETRKRHFGDVKPGQELKETSKAAEGAGIGGSVGLGVGAALGALVAAATAVVIPGLGLVVAGPIAGAIAGAGAGGATGTLVGALIGAGIPESRAAEYERGLKDGGVLMGMRAEDPAQATELEHEFTGYGARNVRR
jgi:uncharacterized protein YjbJ (UPF0337 family)